MKLGQKLIFLFRFSLKFRWNMDHGPNTGKNERIKILRPGSWSFATWDQYPGLIDKSFLQSKYDYCSTLFFHFSNKSNSDRLDKSFAKSIRKYLNIKIDGFDLTQQYNHLKEFKILPLKLRYFQNFVFFTFKGKWVWIPVMAFSILYG